MIVYGSSVSPFVKKVMTFLDQKGLAYEMVRTNEDAEGFSACSPFRKIPAIRDDSYLLSDSSAICAYIDAQYPAHNLIPTEPKAHGRAMWWDEFADTIFGSTVLTIFFNRIAAPLFFNRPFDLAAADKAEHETLPPILAYLEKALPESGWLVEDRITLADISVGSFMANMHHLNIAIDAKELPKLAAFRDKIFQLSTFAETLSTEAAFIEKMKNNQKGN